MQQHNDIKVESHEFLEIEQADLPSDAYSNCCHFLIGKEHAESRD